LTTLDLLDWNEPWFSAGLLDWNGPDRSQGLSPDGVDGSTYARAVLEVRADLELPPRPPRLTGPKKPPKPDPTESGLDIKVFIALMEVAQHARLTYESDAQGRTKSAEMTLGTVSSPPVVRPADSDLPKAALRTKNKMIRALGRTAEILAQNVEPDRFFLDALGMHRRDFPYTHALARVSILGANVFCLRLKERFRLLRPSQVRGDDKKPVLLRAPLLPLPAHSAFPGGHAMQGAAVATVLQVLLRQKPPPDLMELAARVAENREIAGLHHDLDTAAGLEAGRWFGGALFALAAEPGATMLMHLIQEAEIECDPDGDQSIVDESNGANASSEGG